MILPLDDDLRQPILSSGRAAAKRIFDLAAALLMLPFALPVMLLFMLLAWISAGQAIYGQDRVGLFGQPFRLYKICSMRAIPGYNTNVTTSADPRITRLGRFIRRTKIDELPQLFNVLRGDMSFVGPRPDVAEAYADLPIKYAPILCLRPGITAAVSVEFADEEKLLGEVDNPDEYYRLKLFPMKAERNLEYTKKQSILGDIMVMLKTVLVMLR